jgi:hypothetical protein
MRLAFSVVLLITASASQATVVTWYLQNVTFDDGGSASGFFTIDTDTDWGLTDFDIKTTSGGSITSSFEYTPATASRSLVDGYQGASVMFLTPPLVLPRHALHLFFPVNRYPAIETSGTIPLDPYAGSPEIVSSLDEQSFRSVNAGAITTDSHTIGVEPTSPVPLPSNLFIQVQSDLVPEPSVQGLLAVGLIALLVGSNQRRRGRSS